MAAQQPNQDTSTQLNNEALLGAVVEPSMGPLRDLVFMAHVAAPFSFVSPSMDACRLLLVSPTSFSTSRLPLHLLLCQPRRDL